MSNPLAIFEDLRDTYFRYLDSPFDLRYPDLVAERRALLDVDGRLYRRPLIEPVPAYQTLWADILPGSASSPGTDLAAAARRGPVRVRVAGALSSSSPERTAARAVHAPACGLRGVSRPRERCRGDHGNRLGEDRMLSPADRCRARSRVDELAGARPTARAVGLVEPLDHAGGKAALGSAHLAESA
jgi:hypothetical protein